MSRYILVLFCSGAILACKRTVVPIGLDRPVHNLLLQERKGNASYIFLPNADTAYFEWRRFDKPSYFTGFDTLILVGDSNHYLGKYGDLLIASSKIRFTSFGQNKKPKEFYFSVATERQIGKWNYYKNADKYFHYASRIDSMLYPIPANSLWHTGLKKDWDLLYGQLSVLDQTRFDSVLNIFKTKYSLR